MDKKIDSYHAHEALDRIHVIRDTFASHILDHPFIENHPNCKKLAEEVFHSMCELYQMVGTEGEYLYEKEGEKK